MRASPRTELIYIKKIISVILALFIFVPLLPVMPAAAESDGVITVSTLTAKPGDLICIDFMLSENPYLEAVTISLTYEPYFLIYQGYQKGIMADYTVSNNADKDMVRLVAMDMKSQSGLLIQLIFKVNRNSFEHFSPVTVDCQPGDFCSRDMKKLMPEIVGGGVNIVTSTVTESSTLKTLSG